MRGLRVTLLLLLPVAALAMWRVSRAPSSEERRIRHVAREVGRLRAHFDSVDVELRGRDVAGLSSAQRAARARAVAWLRDYRDAGVFPGNDCFADRPMPFFRDRRGVLCAMAYLIDRSGKRDIVDRIARTRNNAFVAELADDPGLHRWLEDAGLTLSEAARIQPAYRFEDTSDPDDVSSGYAIASIVFSGASLATVGLNAFAPSKATGWAGVIAGSAATIAGLANVEGTSGEKKVASVNLIAGGAALGAGLYRLFTVRPVTRTADRVRAGLPARVEFAVVPGVDASARTPEVRLVLRGAF